MTYPRLRASLCVATAAVLPMVLSGFLLTLEAGPGTKEEDAESLRLFNNVLVLVEENYATRIDSERAVFGAIDGMLRTLDPHSKFLEPKAFKSLREDQTGSYAGLGIQVQSLFGKVTIVSRPFPDSPAEKAGLRVGDMITHVDGRSTTGLAVEEVVTKLRGVAGTGVHIDANSPCMSLSASGCAFLIARWSGLPYETKTAGASVAMINASAPMSRASNPLA